MLTIIAAMAANVTLCVAMKSELGSWNSNRPFTLEVQEPASINDSDLSYGPSLPVAKPHADLSRLSERNIFVQLSRSQKRSFQSQYDTMCDEWPQLAFSSPSRFVLSYLSMFYQSVGPGR